MKQWIVGAALGAMSTMAIAADGSIDARLAGGAFEIKGDGEKIEIESGGFDLRGHVNVTPNVFLRGEYSLITSDEVKYNGDDYDSDTDTSLLRLGAGYQGAVGSVLMYGALEYGSIKLDNDDLDTSTEDGVILSGGVKDNGTGRFLWNVELGAVKLDELEGAVFDFTIGYRINPTFAVIFGGQGYALEDDDDYDYSLSNGYLGVRITL